MKPEASFYIPKEETSVKEVNHTLSNQSKGLILDALNNQNSKLTFDLGTMCDNLTLQGQTEFTQRYAVGAITKIINGQPVTNRTMLDSLFNTYAPAFNASLVKSGYNSVAAMKDAALKGTINPASFLGALDSGLAAIQEEADSLSRFDKYGDEIPVDVIEECKYLYDIATGVKKTLQETGIAYIDYLKPIEITLTAHIKNENAKTWNINECSDKLANAMAAKKPIVLRVGQNIYEDIIIEKYNPIITNAYDIKFIATIIYTYSAAQKTIANRQTKSLLGKCIDKTVKNWASKSEYLGSYPVEKVTKNDSVIISQIKKIIGKDTIIIDGEEV